MEIRILPVSAIESIPPDAYLHLDQPVVIAADRLWLLIATRRHPGDGVMKALLLSPDRSMAAACPAAMVTGYRHSNLEIARQEQPELVPITTGPELLGPVDIQGLHVRRAIAVFDNDIPADCETVVAGGQTFYKLAV